MRYASPADYQECRRLHRKFGTTYFFASRAFPRRIRQRVDALYGFVRVPDEWVDNPGPLTLTEQVSLLSDYRAQLVAGVQEGICPEHPVLRAFCDVVRDTGLGLDEPLLFLDAMAQDLTVTRYETYAELERYMRGSAAAVGVMMLSVLQAQRREGLIEAAKALGDAMQLTNFLRDVGEDLQRGRVYLPQEDMQRFGVTLAHLHEGVPTPEFCSLMRFEIERARALYAVADRGIDGLPSYAQRAVRTARVLYSRILDRIEDQSFDVFTSRARTSSSEKLLVATRTFLGFAS